MVSELSFWAPIIIKIVYAGPPGERRKLFKEMIVLQKINVFLTTYEYLMNKHDRPKLSIIQWHYVIINEGRRINNAYCKLNTDLKHYKSTHRLLLTGTPPQVDDADGIKNVPCSISGNSELKEIKKEVSSTKDVGTQNSTIGELYRHHWCM